MSDSVSAALAAIQEGQQRLMVSLEQLGSDLLSRMDRVDSAIAAIRDDITVTMRLADRAQEAADQTRGELCALGDRVTAMMHQIQDLQDEVRRLKDEGPHTEQAGMDSRGFAR
jgi:chromosome segregation ATPase